ncbi:phosphotransferase family protein [Quadrisphaera sp. KR29]|uniref:phosphotransferase family protein n=1 Tax=Quadrisphaera sp. KR29 TaxID=3461391 RepID=UPI004044BF23
MRGEGGSRARWEDLPGTLRDAVGAELGSPVVSAVSQPGGFSPGSADRVVAASGRRAFVKALDGERHPGSVELHRREARVLGALPAGLPVPALLALVERAGWVALVTEDVDGASPALPWQRAGVEAALDALGRVAAADLPAALRAVLPRAQTGVADDFAGFERLLADPWPDLERADPWAGAHLEELAAVARRGTRALEGASLVHGDVRADNLVQRPDGGVVVVDWPHALLGSPVFDVVALLLNARLSHSEVDVDALLAQPLTGSGDDATAVLAGMAAYFVDAGRQPPVPGLPALRHFQAAQGVTALAWLRERWWPSGPTRSVTSTHLRVPAAPAARGRWAGPGPVGSLRSASEAGPGPGPAHRDPGSPPGSGRPSEPAITGSRATSPAHRFPPDVARTSMIVAGRGVRAGRAEQGERSEPRGRCGRRRGRCGRRRDRSARAG